jgi:hypothetical protein
MATIWTQFLIQFPMNFLVYWEFNLATKKSDRSNDACVKLTRAPLIRVAEHASVATLINSKRAKIRIDECVVRKGIRCDWVVSKENCVDVLIELKGADVNHAVDQLLATIEIWRNHPLRGKNTKLAALVVCSQYPRIDTRVQRAKKIFASKFGMPLHISSRGGEFDFCKLASFTA